MLFNKCQKISQFFILKNHRATIFKQTIFIPSRYLLLQENGRLTPLSQHNRIKGRSKPSMSEETVVDERYKQINLYDTKREAISFMKNMNIYYNLKI